MIRIDSLRHKHRCKCGRDIHCTDPACFQDEDKYSEDFIAYLCGCRPKEWRFVSPIP